MPRWGRQARTSYLLGTWGEVLRADLCPIAKGFALPVGDFVSWRGLVGDGVDGHLPRATMLTLLV